MAQGFRFMPLGLVRLRTFRLSTWGFLGATLTQVFARACGQSWRNTQRCHNSPHWKRGYGVRVTSRIGRARRIWGGFEKVSELRWDLPRRKTVGFSLARGDLSGGCHTCWGWADEKARIERLCLFLSLCRRTFKLKGNKKSFVSEKRSRKCFSCFEIPDVLCYIYIYIIWTLYVHFTHSHIMALVHSYFVWGVTVSGDKYNVVVVFCY